MKKLIAIPKFEGFYHSDLDLPQTLTIVKTEAELGYHGDMTEDQFEDIDWVKTHNNIGREYLYKWLELNKEILEKLGLTFEFKGIKSPTYYNFKTDELETFVTFDKEKLQAYIRENVKQDNKHFIDFLRNNYASCSGFQSFYKYDSKIWLSDYLNEIDEKNVIFEGFLNFLCEPLGENMDISELANVEFIEYKN